MATEQEMQEAEEIYQRLKRDSEKSADSVQDYFNKFHDKLFTLNCSFIAIIIALSKFTDKSVMELWYCVFPICAVLIILFLNYFQIGIQRFNSKILEWRKTDWGKSNRMYWVVHLLSAIVIGLTVYTSCYILYNCWIYENNDVLTFKLIQKVEQLSFANDSIQQVLTNCQIQAEIMASELEN